jgi:hypothetical protein
VVYDGEPIVTPVIRGLFGPLSLSGEDEPLTEVQNNTEGKSASWSTIMESLMEELGVDDGLDLDEGVDAQIEFPEPQATLVSAVSERFGSEAGKCLDEILSRELPSDTDADVQDLCELALLMRDGHNLVSVWAQGAWGSDRVEAGTFGGWAQFVSRNVSLVMNTERLCDIASTMDKVCSQTAPNDGKGVQEALESLDVVSGGCIRDGKARASFRRAMADWLLQKAVEDEQAAMAEGA